MVTYWLNGEETSSETESALEQGAEHILNILSILNKVPRIELSFIRTKYNIYEAFDGKIPLFLPQEIHHKNKQQDHFEINVM